MKDSQWESFMKWYNSDKRKQLEGALEKEKERQTQRQEIRGLIAGLLFIPIYLMASVGILVALAPQAADAVILFFISSLSR